MLPAVLLLLFAKYLSVTLLLGCILSPAWQFANVIKLTLANCHAGLKMQFFVMLAKMNPLVDHLY